MTEITASVEEVITDDFIESHAEQIGTDVLIPLKDGTVRLPIQLVVLNALLWSIYVHFNIPITKAKVFFPDRKVDKDTGKAVFSFTSETVNRCVSSIYNELILDYQVPDMMDALMQVWICINRFAMFADRHTRPYQVSLDALSLAELCVQPPMKKIISRPIDASHGIKIAEQQFEKTTKDLMEALGKEGLLKNNVLKPFMLTKLLKRNQVPQMFFAFGTRSDIDDSMMKHPIGESAFSGLKSVADFAIETLSAKKAEYFNSSVIQDAQYFARRCRLAVSSMPNLYAGHCGNTHTLTYTIPEANKYNYLGKYVKVDDQTRDLLAKRKHKPQHYEDESVELTKENIDRFVGRPIQMWTIFGCRHIDGFCEHCAGYKHQRLKAYVPPGIHIGVFSATKAVSAVTQKILSAKHLIKTSSKEFAINPRASRFFTKSGDAIIWQPGVARGMRRCKIRIESRALHGPLSDLTRKVIPSGVSFAKINKIGIINDKGTTIDILEMSDGVTYPYFSAYAMEYMKNHYDQITVDSDYIDIPMQDFDFNRAVLRYTAVNDDMVSFVKRVESFLMGSKDCVSIKDYTNIATCLQDFSEIIYAKTDVDIFHIEVMLRGYLVDPTGKPGIPVVEDLDGPVMFDGMCNVISNAALSTKLSFQGLGNYFSSAKPMLNAVGAVKGYNDALFHFARRV